jgi:hypothetical protein
VSLGCRCSSRAGSAVPRVDLINWLDSLPNAVVYSTISRWLLLFEVFSQRYERGSTVVTSNLPFDEWTSVLGSERLTGALLDRLTHHVHILQMNGDSYRLNQSKRRSRPASSHTPTDNPTQA